MTKALIEREYYVALVYRKLGMYEQLKLRWKQIGYNPINLQLDLFS